MSYPLHPREYYAVQEECLVQCPPIPEDWEEGDAIPCGQRVISLIDLEPPFEYGDVTCGNCEYEFAVDMAQVNVDDRGIEGVHWFRPSTLKRINLGNVAVS